MTSNEREDSYDRLYSQVINTILHLNFNNNTQRHWRPIDGVGEIADEQFVGNYMIDSNKSVGHFL
jgi:hypothetical protein